MPDLDTKQKEKRGRDRHVKEIVRGSGVAFLLKASGSLLSFALSLALTRSLGADGAGIYFLAFTLTTLVASFSRLGLDTAVVRFAAISWEKRDRGSLSHLARTVLGIALLTTTAGALLLFSTAPWLASVVFEKPELLETLAWMSFTVISLSVSLLIAQLLKGVKRIRGSQLLEVILVPGLTILGVLSLSDAMGAPGAALSVLIATLICTITGLVLSRQLWQPKPEDSPEVDCKRLLTTSLPLLGVSSVNMLTNAAAPMFLGRFSSLTDVAIYTTTSKAAFLTTILLASVTSISAPKFSALFAQGKMRELEYAVRKVNLLLTVIAAPILAIYLVFAGEIMALFGPGFVVGTPALMILAVGQFISVTSGSVGNLLIMSGHEKTTLKVMMAVSVGNVVLNLILVPQFGFIGAAIATAATLIGKNLYGIVMARRLLGMSVSHLLSLTGRRPSAI